MNANKWVYLPTGYTCRTRKEMKDYIGSSCRFDAAMRNKQIQINNYVAVDELQKNNGKDCG